MTVDIESIQSALVTAGVIEPMEYRITPLAGGVSSEICILEGGNQRLVVKQALDTLKVEQLWRVDITRNTTEQRFIQEVSTFLPRSVPDLVHCDENRNYFVMEYLEGFHDWKSLLLAGRAEAALARQAGSILGTIHSKTWADHRLLQRFDTTDSFHALRTDPYLLATAIRHPVLRRQIRREAARLEQNRLCLVHGDFSPKNVMVRDGEMVILDCEVAWYGEPAFDLAFLFKHFLLKGLYHRGRAAPFVDLVAEGWDGYRSGFGTTDPDLEQRTGRLLLMLLLARVDGKSPVEYIDDQTRKQIVRDFVYELLPLRVFELEHICNCWVQYLDSSRGP